MLDVLNKSDKETQKQVKRNKEFLLKVFNKIDKEIHMQLSSKSDHC